MGLVRLIDLGKAMLKEQQVADQKALEPAAAGGIDLAPMLIPVGRTNHGSSRYMTGLLQTKVTEISLLDRNRNNGRAI